MSSPCKLLLVSGVLLALSACGFEPVYGDAALQATHTPLQGNLTIEPLGATGRENQVFKAAMEDIFNPEGIKFASPDYRLQVMLHKTLIPAVVKSDGTVQRYDVRFDSDFKLFQAGKPVAVFTGSLRRSASYDVTSTAEFATYEADKDITERILKEMAEDYMLRLSGHFAATP